MEIILKQDLNYFKIDCRCLQAVKDRTFQMRCVEASCRVGYCALVCFFTSGSVFGPKHVKNCRPAGRVRSVVLLYWARTAGPTAHFIWVASAPLFNIWLLRGLGKRKEKLPPPASTRMSSCKPLAQHSFAVFHHHSDAAFIHKRRLTDRWVAWEIAKCQTREMVLHFRQGLAFRRAVSVCL